MNIKRLHIITLLICLLTSVGLSQNSDRPDNLTLTNFQFGPINRWSYSHIREILPTANDYIFFGKNNKISTSSLRGYFAEVEMKNDSTASAELFAVSAEI